MNDSGIYVQDIAALERLDQKLYQSADRMLHIDQDVCAYLNDVEYNLTQKLNDIQQQLNAAESRLHNAQAALASCRSSQSVNEYGIVTPSCLCEERDVSDAQCEVDKWQSRYEQGQQIVRDYKQDVSDYQSGGHSLVLNMGVQQQTASSQLCDSIHKLQDILSANMSIDTAISNAGNATGVPMNQK